MAEAFLKDQITIGHALLIAKLPASQQQEAFAAAFRGMWTSEGNSQVLIPVRELAVWIETNVLLQLASAPFDKQDEKPISSVSGWHNLFKRQTEPLAQLLVEKGFVDKVIAPDHNVGAEESLIALRRALDGARAATPFKDWINWATLKLRLAALFG